MELNSRKRQGLWWNRELKKETLLFWKSHAEESKFQDFYTAFTVPKFVLLNEDPASASILDIILSSLG